MKKTHLYEIDFMRTFIMLGVLSVHTMTIFTNQMEDWSFPSLAMSAVHSSMHLTRMAFMFITGLVLFVTYYQREMQVLSFWKKRLSLIAVPYLFWNIIYILFRCLYELDRDGSLLTFLKELGTSLIHGDEFYIYFVLISFQFYLIFPFLLFGFRKYEKWHFHIFIGSVILQLVLMAFYKFAIPHIDTSGWPYLLSHYGVFVLSYQCWFIARLESASSGTVLMNGEKLHALNHHPRMMVQDGRLLPWKKVIENIGVGLSGHWRNKALETLRCVGLEDRALNYPSSLSGGLRQRVALARALQS